MKHDVLFQPSYALLRMRLDAGDAIQAEPGAMVSMSAGIQIETKAQGGILSGLARKFLTGESFFMNTFRAQQAGEITFAPSAPGDVVAVDLTGNTVFAQSGAFLASGTGIAVETAFGGARSFFSREGLFLLKLTGTGPLFLSSYGGIHRVDLKAGETYTIDTGHMVAFTDTVKYNVRRVGGLKSTLFGGEGLVADYTGPGTVWMQTRSPESLASWLMPFLPRSGSTNG